VCVMVEAKRRNQVGGVFVHFIHKGENTSLLKSVVRDSPMLSFYDIEFGVLCTIKTLHCENLS
jgi:hypothetical protein